jgi:hypothetical protein
MGVCSTTWTTRAGHVAVQPLLQETIGAGRICDVPHGCPLWWLSPWKFS